MLIRITPGVRPSTHENVQTGQLDSKFGLGIADGLAAAGIAAVLSSSSLDLVGLHAHIGSQIFELEPYVRTIEALAELADPSWCRLLNVGGGLGIAYTEDDEPPSVDDYAAVKVEGVRRVLGDSPRILVEPGRSLVGNAGITAYTVGTLKEIPGVRTYVAVDGGMSDNLRPMLYGVALRGADRRPRRRAGDDARHGRRHALRVERHDRPRRPDRRAAAGRRAGDAGDRRLRPRDGEQLQRRPPPTGRLREGRRRTSGRSP